MRMSRILIIAEAGVNHNGDLKMAEEMIRAAKDCGADIVKFQTAKLDALVSKRAGMADYQKKNTGCEQSQKEMLKKLLLPFADFTRLFACCLENDIQFLSTPFDLESIDFLDDMVEMWKIPSGEITNFPYLAKIGQTGKRVLLSTGMSDCGEIRQAVDILREYGTPEITLLHCTSEYPAPLPEVNLRAMEAMRKEFDCPVGYSDHTQGIAVARAAAARGAEVIEKHFTLDCSLPGPDHRASLEPHEFKNMVDGIRAIELALGAEVKAPTASEQKNREVARKSIVAAKAIAKGERLTEENLTTKRPGSGISPMRWREVLGTCAVRDFMEDDLIEL